MHRDRRDFLKQSLVLAGTAGLLTSGLTPIAARAQTLGPMRRANRYDDTFIHERKPFAWPGNKTLAVWIAPNVEVWHYDSPTGQAVSPNTANRVPDGGTRAHGRKGLTDRELDVLDKLAQGKANKEIARELHLSQETVKTYVKHILGKLGVHTRTQAAVQALTGGLLRHIPERSRRGG